jgi:hypothetical protein
MTLALLLGACSSPSSPPANGEHPNGGQGASGGTLNGAGGQATIGGAPGSVGGSAGQPSLGGGGAGGSGGQFTTNTGGASARGGASSGAGGQGASPAAGAAGSTMNAGASGTTSISGGAGMGGMGGGGGSGAGTGGGPAGGASGSDCGSLPLCDSFESTAVGATPSSALWTLVPSSASGSATVDSMGAHGSSRSLKVVSPDRLYLRNTSVIGTLGNVVHVRFYVRFATALAAGHGALIVTHPTMVDQYSQSNELRFGSQDSVFHWNTDSDAANIPDVSPNGDATSFKPDANTWYCVELTVNTNGNLNASVDGAAVAGLTEDGMATANIDQAWVGSTDSLSRYKTLADFNFGWQSYGGGALTLWYDDVALSSSPIGCQ